ncbi:hypothetical protein QBC32DRAFT_347718 [Pseudoneurospora amorphoporcata]|uniref:BTB domain-containing protein n=1 Tax=Pseudoneurospora amorphoporcata TaxID=241081 RepID=A0AAN6NQK8_9PEZI|nr:hypothetical protein QBC32DRAFT_347718 [Pseudoneurospora amorphoporcata]
MGDSTTSQVSPTGDIILVVGPPEEKQLRLRVSSTILRSASKVFDAMFSPPWIESTRTLSPESPKDIELPEDDAEAMKAICYAIHHRPEMIPFVDTSGKQILQAVRTIDKYDLSTAMQLVTDRWLRHQLPAKSVEDLLYMAAAASVLKNHEAFSKLTWLAMITHKGSYRPLLNDDRFKELFPAGFFCKHCPLPYNLAKLVYRNCRVKRLKYHVGRFLCAFCAHKWPLTPT